MKIINSNVNMNASNIFFHKHEKSEKFNLWIGKRPEENNTSPKERVKSILSELVEKLKDSMKEISINSNELTSVSDENGIKIDDKEKMKIKIVQTMLEKLTGKKIKFVGIDDIDKLEKEINKIKQNNNEIIVLYDKNGEERNAQAGWGLEYDYHEVRQEYEKMEFKSSGIVKTADGKEINFDVSIMMERSFYEENNLSVRLGDAAKDPLVINYDGNAPDLSDIKFEFDIDADGSKDNISFVNQGSGFLALDKNGNGKIDDGTELFGPESGNGFDDLAKYDEDNNGWIDESDSIFNNLKIWTKDESGKDHLFALMDKDVGAIYLGNVESKFDIKHSIDSQLGTVRKTGVFLKENGIAGTVQHIDINI